MNTLLHPGRAQARIEALLARNIPVVEVLVGRSGNDAPPIAPGRRRLVWPGGTEGTLGSPRADHGADEEAHFLLATGQTGPDTAELEGPGGEHLLLQCHRPPPGLLIVGAGHLARPVHELAALLGWRITVADDRPDFAVPEPFPHAHRVARIDFRDPFAGIPPAERTHVLLVTRGHKYDYECLRHLLLEDRAIPPRWIGMIGSRRRVRATFHQLLEEGVARSELLRIHAPVGLDLGAETPEEIAVSIAAQWVLHRRGGSGRPLVDTERIADRFFPEDSGGQGGGPDPDAVPDAGHVPGNGSSPGEASP